MVLTTSQMNDEIIIAVGHAINDKYLEIMSQEFDERTRTYPRFDENQIYEFGELAISTYYKNRYSIEEQQ